MDKRKNYFDIVIIGGGFSGLTTACSLSRFGLKIALIEKNKFNKITHIENDGRAFALAYGSKIFLEEIGVWQKFKNESCPINDIRVSDRNSKFFLHYNHEIVGKNPMGYMVETHNVINSLFDKVNALDEVFIFENSQVLNIEKKTNYNEIILQDKVLKASLTIGADGKFSNTRELFSIDSNKYDYKQYGIVCKIKHDKHHNFTAQEKFLQTGPIAILPLNNGYESSIVWTEKSAFIDIFNNMSKDELCNILQDRVGSFLGNIDIISKIYYYPLLLSHAKKYYANRFVLVADAAHAIHPLAGQGFNLGVRDIKLLSQRIEENLKLGLDFGSSSLLKEYNKLRKFDSASLIMITTLLNWLFLNNNLLIEKSRRIGMATINNIVPAKKFFISHAMGI